MPCRSPLKQYYGPNGHTSFKWTLAECWGPNIYHELPCGMCRDCRIRRVTDWATRAHHEAQMHDRNVWINPTYSPEHDPISVSRKDGQVLFRALRKRGRTFKMFGCAEYGGKLGRPHMHLLLFGTDFEDKYFWKTVNGRPYYRSPELESIWTKGHILIGDVNRKTASYVAGYVQKKITGDLAEDHYVRNINGILYPVEPEVQFNSPGLGWAWLEKYWRDVYPADEVIIDGKHRPVPRGYDRWLSINYPNVWEKVRKARESEAIKKLPETALRKAQAARARDGFYDQQPKRRNA